MNISSCHGEKGGPTSVSLPKFYIITRNDYMTYSGFEKKL
ncbi:unnamed protein product [Nezara viridula]|uniref:Uncharacterized protein n=1 Tax=Nezara viridula TaxID=85310 RepID=A0A9P0HDH7_NEZVI|nr:unnamed protein product [Nezara viridula]